MPRAAKRVKDSCRARAATQSWVGLNPGHRSCYWSFQRAWACRERARVSPAVVWT